MTYSTRAGHQGQRLSNEGGVSCCSVNNWQKILLRQQQQKNIYLYLYIIQSQSNVICCVETDTPLTSWKTVRKETFRRKYALTWQLTGVSGQLTSWNLPKMRLATILDFWQGTKEKVWQRWFFLQHIAKA